METAARGNTPSTSGMSNNTEGTLNKASSSAHAAVNSIAGAADEAARKAKPAIDRVAATPHQAVDKAAGAAARRGRELQKEEGLEGSGEKTGGGSRGYRHLPFRASRGEAVGVGVFWFFCFTF